MGEWPPRPSLGAKETAVLNYLREFVRTNYRAPTNAEGARDLYGSDAPRSFAYWVEKLVEKGYVRRGEGHRNIELVDPPDCVLVFGQVACGGPLPTGEGWPERLDLNAIFGADDILVVRARGDSMTDAGILPGDLIAVRRTPEARSGETVLVRIEDEYTLKVLVVRGKGAKAERWLQPCNAQYEKRRLDPLSDSEIVGVFVGSVRLPKK